MSKTISFAVIALVAFGLLACAKKEEVKFAAYDEASFQAARAQGKPTLVFATAEWCGPCRSLHAHALTDPAVKAALEPFARLEIDCTDKNDPTINPKLMQFTIRYLPALVFFDKAGKETDRFEGEQTVETLVEAARTASK